MTSSLPFCISRKFLTATALVTPSQVVVLSRCKSWKEYSEGSVFKRYCMAAILVDDKTVFYNEEKTQLSVASHIKMESTKVPGVCMAASPRPEFTVTRRPQPEWFVHDLLKLQKASHAISSTLDLDELLNKVVHEVVGWFGCMETSVWLHDELTNEMVLAG